MSQEVLPQSLARAKNWEKEPLVPLKYQHSDGSITAPDSFGEQVLPPSSERAALYEKAKPQSIKYLLPDGRAVDGGGLLEMVINNVGGEGIPGPPGKDDTSFTVMPGT